MKPLSQREIDVIRILMTGAPDKMIGRILGIATNTVKLHLKHISYKLNLTGRVQIAMWGGENLLKGDTNDQH
jgi:DNA-binding NarL/FixJ family response regulator